jgi:hypothetical protein
MKKIIIPLVCIFAIQSCTINDFSCHPFGITICEVNSDSSYVNEDFILYAGLGKTMIQGDTSWNDPIGAQVGLEYEVYRITENLSFNTGLGISYQGSAYEEPEFSGVVRLSYVSVPLLMNYECDRGIYGEIGLQPGFLLFARDKIDGSPESWSYGNAVKGFELGLPLGAGYRINEKLRLGVRATYGLTNMENWGSDIANHNLLITGVAAYRINWAKWLRN